MPPFRDYDPGYGYDYDDDIAASDECDLLYGPHGDLEQFPADCARNLPASAATASRNTPADSAASNTEPHSLMAQMARNTEAHEDYRLTAVSNRKH